MSCHRFNKIRSSLGAIGRSGPSGPAARLGFPAARITHRHRRAQTPNNALEEKRAKFELLLLWLFVAALIGLSSLTAWYFLAKLHGE